MCRDEPPLPQDKNTISKRRKTVRKEALNLHLNNINTLCARDQKYGILKIRRTQLTVCAKVLNN